jgi:RNA polymerase sigma-70 factor (ECF subfamily)
MLSSAREGQSETGVTASADSAREVKDETDAVLVSAVARGDAGAFRVLTERHLVAVHRLSARMLGDLNEAEEVAQDTFLKLWTHASRWRPDDRDGQVLPWLRSIAMNACIDRLRRRRFNSGEEIPERQDEAASAAERIDQCRLGALVSSALGALADRQRAAIILTYYEELPNAEAAAAMGLHLKAFESLLLRARHALKASMAAMGIGSADLREVA